MGPRRQESRPAAPPEADLSDFTGRRRDLEANVKGVLQRTRAKLTALEKRLAELEGK